MRPFLQRSGIRRVEHHGLDENFRNRFLIKKGAWIQFFDQRLLMLDRHFSYPAMESSRGWCDLLLVTENTYLETEKLRQLVRIRMVVTGAEISEKLTDFLENDCGKTGTGFYSVKRSWAVLLSLNNPRSEERRWGKKG